MTTSGLPAQFQSWHTPYLGCQPLVRLMVHVCCSQVQELAHLLQRAAGNNQPLVVYLCNLHASAELLAFAIAYVHQLPAVVSALCTANLPGVAEAVACRCGMYTRCVTACHTNTLQARGNYRAIYGSIMSIIWDFPHIVDPKKSSIFDHLSQIHNIAICFDQFDHGGSEAGLVFLGGSCTLGCLQCGEHARGV
jgi:hypothetical protein